MLVPRPDDRHHGRMVLLTDRPSKDPHHSSSNRNSNTTSITMDMGTMMAMSSTTMAMATTMDHRPSPSKEDPMDEGVPRHSPTTATKTTILVAQLLDLRGEAAIHLVVEEAR